MQYVELIKECKEAIRTGKCLGCSGLENPLYKGNPKCEVHKRNEGEQITWKELEFQQKRQ